ncbi:hypothetical protein MMPV_000915 [Pyropia vietnamensis]
MAFVSTFAAPVGTVAARGSSFAGAAVSTAAPTISALTPTARLGTVAGNTSLDKLGLDKQQAERFSVMDNCRPAGFSSDYEEIISNVYRTVFGNAYIMDSERATMAKDESEFRDGRTTVKDFIRALVKSNEYKRRFFDSRPLYGAIELAYKHVLGRTPDGLEEYRVRSAVYDTKGYDAYMDSFFDDGEYDEAFGEDMVPYLRGHLTTTNKSMAAFTHMFQMHRGSGVSDKSNPRTMVNGITLNRAGIRSIPLPVVAPGSAGASYFPVAPNPGSWISGVTGGDAARTSHGGRNEGGGMFRVEATGFGQRASVNGAAGVPGKKLYRGRNGSRSAISQYRFPSQSYLVPYNELSAIYQKIHKQGGVIASITPVHT